MSGTVDNSVPPELAEHVEAVVREAVTNAVRHASATELTVLIDAGEDVVITVQDNGVGIPADASRSGLRNLAHRASKFGGTLAVRPTEGGGACVVWRVPLT
jgi:signal transduction histidine kinase